MTDPKALKAAVAEALQRVPPVIDDYRARADYGPALAAKVATLERLTVSLRSVQAEADPTPDTLSALALQVDGRARPLVAAQIDANIAMANMGQLNTARTIAPAVAKANDANLAALQTALQTLSVALEAAGALVPPRLDPKDISVVKGPAEPDLDREVADFSAWAESLRSKAGTPGASGG